VALTHQLSDPDNSHVLPIRRGTRHTVLVHPTERDLP
jgi:hypothetical protein